MRPPRKGLSFASGFVIAFVCVLLVLVSSESQKAIERAAEEDARVARQTARQPKRQHAPSNAQRETPGGVGQEANGSGYGLSAQNVPGETPQRSDDWGDFNGESVADGGGFESNGAAPDPFAEAESNALTVVEAELIAKSTVPTLGEIAPLKDALVVYEYLVRRWVSGPERGDRVRVAHWVLRDGASQTAATAKIGSRRTLRLRSFDSVGHRTGIHISDTLRYNANAPLFIDIPQRADGLVMRGANAPSKPIS